jgi:plasmid segregation protein ParM
MILGIDAGNEVTKICGQYGVDKFLSDIGEYRERRLVQTFDDDDMIWEYDGRKGFAGSLARFESEFGGSMRGTSKAHFDAKIRVLLAIHRYVDNTNGDYRIVVGQPIETHTDDAKQAIRDMLIGTHELTVNGKRKVIRINRVEVAAEGGASAMADPRKGLMRIIDIGSGTINYATLNNMRYVDRDSFTDAFGMSTNKSADLEAMARRIASRALNKWDTTDYVRLAGGGADVLLPYIREHLVNTEVLRPKVRFGDSIKLIDATYANAVGFYEIARRLYNE